MSKHRFNDIKEVDDFIAGKINPQPQAKAKPSLVELQRRAVLRGIKAKLPTKIQLPGVRF